MTDRERATERLADRLTAVWTRVVLRISRDGEDSLGRHLRFALEQTEAECRKFCEFVTTPAADNGKPAQPLKEKR